MPVIIKKRIYYRSAEVCQKIGISRSTLLRWLKGNIIAEPPRDRREWRLFTEHDVNRIRLEAKMEELQLPIGEVLERMARFDRFYVMAGHRQEVPRRGGMLKGCNLRQEL